jgi:ABC-2 type transport system permease protein
MGSAVVYTRYEVLRTVRNRYFFVFSLIFPLILFFTIAGTNRHARVEGIGFPLYYMTGMIAFGTLAAVVAGGSRIALERSAGWTRQMRITPLPVRSYFAAKLVTSYLMAAISIILISLAGVSLGVHLGAGAWLVMAGLVLVGLVPFAVLGILLGQLLGVDSMGPAIGGITSLFSLLGGAFGPLATSGALYSITKLLPSFWVVQAGKTAVGGGDWPLEGWVVIAVWSAVLGRLAVMAYRRSSTRA